MRTASASGTCLSPTFRDSPPRSRLNSDTAGSLTDVTGAPAGHGCALRSSSRPARRFRARAATRANTECHDRVAAVPGGRQQQRRRRPTRLARQPARSTTSCLPITRDMLMPPVEQRVARQARKCLENFAADSAAGAIPSPPLLATSPTMRTASRRPGPALHHHQLGPRPCDTRRRPTWRWAARTPGPTTIHSPAPRRRASPVRNLVG